MSLPMIRLDHVHKRFRRGERFDSLRDLIPSLARRALAHPRRQEPEARHFWGLRDVCLEIRAGETVGVIGHNGAGKSTMLKHLAGILRPTTGTVEVRGRLASLIEVGAGFHPDLTGRENVYLNGVILGMSRAQIAQRFDEIVDFAGLAGFMDTPVKRYSSGMFARLGFSVAAHLDPDILAIDEVLSVGDFVFQQKSLRKMRAIAGSGATVLFVSHNLKAVADLCARTVLMDSGSVVADGPTEEVVQLYLARERAKLEADRGADVAIRSVRIYDERGSAVRFRPGDKAWVDVTFAATRPVQGLAAVLEVLDESLNRVFYTASELLGVPPVALEAGETCTVTFGLDLHLGMGTFHLGASLYRYDISREFDRVLPAATILVESEVGTRGAANLYPRVERCVLGRDEADEVGAADPVSAVSAQGHG